MTELTPAPFRRERFAFAIVLLFYLALSLLLFDQIEEDAFIYFRLVDNFVHGHGIVFNQGGGPVEAGSSLLWFLLLLTLWKVPLDIVVSAKLLGLVFGSIVLWLVYRLARLQIRDPILRLAPSVLTAASTPFLMWSQRGLDTPLFTAVVMWLVLCLSDPRVFRWWPLAASLLLPARPEGFFFLLGLVPALALGRGQWHLRAGVLAAVAVVAMIGFAARFWYFHDLVPQPFYVRLTLGGMGVLHIKQYLLGSHVYLLAPPLLLMAWKRTFWTRPRLVLIGFVAVTATWCIIANDYMPYQRHLVPAIPLIYVLLVGALDSRIVSFGRRALWGRGYIAIVFLITLCFSKSLGFSGRAENPLHTYFAACAARPQVCACATATKFVAPAAWNPLDAALGQQGTLVNYQSLVGQFLQRNYPADALVVYDQMGQTPYYAGPGMRFVDSLGLTDRHIARFYFQRHKRKSALLRLYDAVITWAVEVAFGEHREDLTDGEALDYLFSLDPDLVLINQYVASSNPLTLPALLLTDPRLQGGYQLRYTLASLALVYEKKGAPRRPRPEVPAGLQVVTH